MDIREGQLWRNDEIDAWLLILEVDDNSVVSYYYGLEPNHIEGFYIDGVDSLNRSLDFKPWRIDEAYSIRLTLESYGY